MKRTFLVKKDPTIEAQDNWLIMDYRQYAAWRETDEGKKRKIVFGKFEACSDDDSIIFMNGRREKARQGGWNGGFAPYGYYLKDNQLLIEETEAEAIRIIFDKFANSDIGLGGVAKYLNLQGIKKIPRQNGTLETWSSHFIWLILDNPVYCGKIAYGRRTREKVKGTKNEYKQVHTDDYILEDGVQ